MVPVKAYRTTLTVYLKAGLHDAKLSMRYTVVLELLVRISVKANEFATRNRQKPLRKKEINRAGNLARP